MALATQGRYLSAAQTVLARLDQPMHYENITEIALKLGLLSSANKTPEIAMSSILSADIRTNSSSVFAKERPGVYRLINPRPTAEEAGERQQHTIGQMIKGIQAKSHISHGAMIVKKAIYLAGRTLDAADDDHIASYSNSKGNRSISIDVVALIGELNIALSEQLRDTSVRSTKQFAKSIERLRHRLQVDDARIVLGFSLFLLDLALDTIDTDGLLIVNSPNATIKLSVNPTSLDTHVA